MYPSLRIASRRSPPGRNARGVTLIELMVAITVLALLLGYGIPSFRNAALNGKLRSLSSSMYASVQFARSEAIKRNRVLTLCASANGTSCASSGGWEQGWIVLDGATVLQHQDAADTGFKVTQAGGTANLQFQPIGVGATSATFTICRHSPLGNQERVVSVTATGSTYVTATETGSCP